VDERSRTHDVCRDKHKRLLACRQRDITRNVFDDQSSVIRHGCNFHFRSVPVVWYLDGYSRLERNHVAILLLLPASLFDVSCFSEIKKEEKRS
jgi:hypothetical protein